MEVIDPNAHPRATIGVRKGVRGKKGSDPHLSTPRGSRRDVLDQFGIPLCRPVVVAFGHHIVVAE